MFVNLFLTRFSEHSYQSGIEFQKLLIPEWCWFCYDNKADLTVVGGAGDPLAPHVSGEGCLERKPLPITLKVKAVSINLEKTNGVLPLVTQQLLRVDKLVKSDQTCSMFLQLLKRLPCH